MDELYNEIYAALDEAKDLREDLLTIAGEFEEGVFRTKLEEIADRSFVNVHDMKDALINTVAEFSEKSSSYSEELIIKRLMVITNHTQEEIKEIFKCRK